MLRYIPLARARARLSLIEFLPTTTAPFTATATMQAASLFLLASAPLAAARELLHLAPMHPKGYGSGGSGGSCYMGHTASPSATYGVP